MNQIKRSVKITYWMENSQNELSDLTKQLLLMYFREELVAGYPLKITFMAADCDSFPSQLFS